MVRSVIEACKIINFNFVHFILEIVNFICSSPGGEGWEGR